MKKRVEDRNKFMVALLRQSSINKFNLDEIQNKPKGEEIVDLEEAELMESN